MHVRIGRRANHDKAGIGTAGDGDHILRHRFGQPNAGIETFRNDIDGTTLQGQFDVHVGIPPQKVCDDGAQDLVRGALVQIDAKRSRRSVAKFVHILHRASNLT
jgi:hypothetical protein